MTVEFNEHDGSLRLTQTEFDRLVSHRPGEALMRATAATAEGPHPILAPGLAVVTESVCRMDIELTDGDGERKRGDGWVAPHGAALLLDVERGLRDFVALPAPLLPAALARLVRLGPRPMMEDGPLYIGDDAHQALRSGTVSAVTVPEPGPLAAALTTGRWRYWAVTATWRSLDGRYASAAVRVLDTTEGWCRFEKIDGDVYATPCNATAIWRELTLLLPDEVAPVGGPV